MRGRKNKRQGGDKRRGGGGQEREGRRKRRKQETEREGEERSVITDRERGNKQETVGGGRAERICVSLGHVTVSPH